MAFDRRWLFIVGAGALAVAASAMVATSGPLDVGGAAEAPEGQKRAGSRFTVVAQPVGDARLAALVVDAETMRLLVYAFDFNKMQLRLAAVRDISQDVRLSHWNNAAPLPEDIRKRLEGGQAHTAPGSGTAPE